MALEAKIVVALNQHLGIDRAVRTMTNRAAFAHRFMLEDKWLGLVAMTLRAGLIESGHREAAGGFHDVRSVRVMTLNTIHFAFNDRMMLREAELCMGFEMAIKATGRVFAGIKNKFSAPTAGGDVLTAGAVAGFAAARACLGGRNEVHPRMRAGGELARVVGVTGQTSLIAHVICIRNFGGHDNTAG